MTDAHEPTPLHLAPDASTLGSSHTGASPTNSPPAGSSSASSPPAGSSPGEAHAFSERRFTGEPERIGSSAARSLLHEWFVRYNPTYLFSAALVLAGLTLVMVELAEQDAFGALWVSATAELYALALIGGAALLQRIGSRRVAVMLGLLAALYQCDLTMHTERSVYLGAISLVSATAWVAFFVVKVQLLAAALQLRLSTSAQVVPALGAAAVAFLPHTFRSLSPDARTMLVAAVLFAVGAAALYTGRRVESAWGFDYRGRRAIRGVWLLWAAGALTHVCFWGAGFGVQLERLIPVAVLLVGTRFAARERGVWEVVATTLAMVGFLVVVGSVRPDGFVVAACIASAAALAIRALRSPTVRANAAPERPRSPYRHAGIAPQDDAPPPEPCFELAHPHSRERLLLGAASTLHVGIWSELASGGLGQPHVWWLDAALVVVCLAALWRRRRERPVAPLVPLVPLVLHFGIESGTLGMPRDLLETGIWAVASGFVLLGGGLGVSWWAHRNSPQEY